MRSFTAVFIRLTLLLYLLGWLLTPSQSSFAAPLQRPPAASGPELIGQLSTQHSAHYLGLETTQRDAMIALTLAYDPQDNPNLRGFVNFLVLTEDGLRRYLTGGDAQELNIASGAPLQFDPIGNKMGAAFRDSGRGKYTVIVYNNSPVPIRYSLSVQNGLLTDDNGQTLSAAANAAAVEEASVEPAQPTTSATPLLTARRLSGILRHRPDRNYLGIQPATHDGEVAFRFVYGPDDPDNVLGKVNFWVLNDDSLRRMVNGEKPEDLNLATGFPVPFNPNPNELQANFHASGHGPYTVVVYSNAPLTVTYALSADGGLLLDPYGQTNEAKAAAVEMAALKTQAPAVTPTPASLAVEPAAAPETGTTTVISVTTTTVFGVDKLAGALTQAYQNRYIGLTPDRLDGTIGLTLDVDPKENQLVQENVNFWVLTDDGLRRVISGAQPQDLSIAMGMPVQYGVDRGKLSAVFNASGHGKYTIIVFNNSDVPVRYLLKATGGLLADETGRLASLP